MRKQESFLNPISRMAASLVFCISLTSTLTLAQAPRASRSSDLLPTPVAGESWLRHLARSFDETSMGKTGRLGPLETTANQESVTRVELAQPPANGNVVLRGSDLYRMNCRGCHGETGTGAPPEINSVINPVRSTSTQVMLDRVKATGAEMSRADAQHLAQQSKTLLLDRLHHGGQDMPAFPHLSEAEITSLVGYLRQLADVPGAGKEQVPVRVQRLRIGEHIAKSICHICHGAAGPNPTLQQLYRGEIPPLSTLPSRVSRAEFIRKVTQGAPITMGDPPESTRGRMPVFYYLSEEEADDVYLYLTAYPPYPYAVLEAGASKTASPAPVNNDDTAPPTIPPSSAGLAPTVRTEPSSDNGFLAIGTLILGLLAIGALASGFWFTVCELRRLSGNSEREASKAKTSHKMPTGPLDPEMAA
jgi:mono/diheme cytochrome c family protein